MNQQNTETQNYNTTLREYLNVLRIQEANKTLPAQFNLTTDQFVKELNQLIAKENSVSISQAM